MGDPISIAASVLAVVTAVKHTAKKISKQWRASKDHAQLVKGLETFESSLVELQSYPEIDKKMPAILEGKEVVQDIHGFLRKTDFPYQKSKTKRRLALIFHVDRVQYFCRRINEVQAKLVFSSTAVTQSLVTSSQQEISQLMKLTKDLRANTEATQSMLVRQSYVLSYLAETITTKLCNLNINDDLRTLLPRICNPSASIHIVQESEEQLLLLVDQAISTTKYEVVICRCNELSVFHELFRHLEAQSDMLPLERSDYRCPPPLLLSPLGSLECTSCTWIFSEEKDDDDAQNNGGLSWRLIKRLRSDSKCIDTAPRQQQQQGMDGVISPSITLDRFIYLLKKSSDFATIFGEIDRQPKLPISHALYERLHVLVEERGCILMCMGSLARGMDAMRPPGEE